MTLVNKENSDKTYKHACYEIIFRFWVGLLPTAIAFKFSITIYNL